MDNQYTRQLALAFLPQATDGAGRGIDSAVPEDENLPNDAYFVIDGQHFAIQGTQFDADKAGIGHKSH